MDISSSEISGLIENEIQLPNWMSILAEQEKDAMRDDLDQISNPEELAEDDIFNGEDKTYLNENEMFQSPEQKMQRWIPDYALNNEHVEMDYNNVLTPNNYHTNSVNEEVDQLVNDVLTTLDRPALSGIQSLISDKFGHRIAFRYIKSNYHRLANLFSDDLKLDPHPDRVIEAEIHDNYHLNNQPREAKITPDDVVKEANQVFTSYKKDELSKYLVEKFGQKLFDKAFTNYDGYYRKQACVVIDKIDHEFKTLTAQKSKEKTNILQKKYGHLFNEYTQTNNLDKIANFINRGNSNFKRENASDHVRDAEQKKKTGSFQDRVMFDTIDIVAKQLLNKKMSQSDVWSELEKKFGDKVSVYSKDVLEKHAKFINRNDEVKIQFNANQDITNEIKSRESKIDPAPFVREAYLRIMSRESLANVKKSLSEKHGSVIAEALNKEAGLKEAEHKLGYFYADANLFSNCDHMVEFFSKKLKYAFLLKEKKGCKGCQSNVGNICKKTSLLLSKNPLKISKDDGQRIITALSDIKMIKSDFADGYMKQLADGDNTPVIKSFLDEARSVVAVKTAKRDVAETQNNDIRSFFNDINDIDVNQLTETKPEFNISF